MSSLWSVPWAHHVVRMAKLKDLPTRRWYMEQTLANGWSRNARHGKAVSNFAVLLPAPQSDLAQQTLKDPYIFDFLTLTEPFQERELETELVRSPSSDGTTAATWATRISTSTCCSTT